MLEYYRYHADLPHPQPAQVVYNRRGAGSGWPEHCPPVRSANSFGWDVINPFEMRFVRSADGAWDIEEAVEVHSDIDLGNGTTPHPQANAWFWEKGQQRPHVITDNVYEAIRHQVKISTYLFLRTEPGWMLAQRDIPNRQRPWGVIESVIETDWYFPAHPWHGVLELPRIEESPIDQVVIEAGEPLFRLVPIQRMDYQASEMSGQSFAESFAEGQAWLGEHGRDPQEGDMDITGAYARQQVTASFNVTPETSDAPEPEGE